MKIINLKEYFNEEELSILYYILSQTGINFKEDKSFIRFIFKKLNTFYNVSINTLTGMMYF